VSDDGPPPAWSEPFAAEVLGALARRRALEHIEREWAFVAMGRGVTVAVIDSGMEADHPRLEGRVVEAVAVEQVGGQPNIVSDQRGDLFGHGTASGGIIVGLAPEVELVSIRVLGDNLKGKGTAFLAGLAWAVERGIEVVNLSLSSRSEALFADIHEVVDEAYFRGTKLVSAANNVAVASYPSLFASVFSVAAHAQPDQWRWYYNPRPPVEFGAWGVDVPIAWKDGGSTVATGNSFAAPHIAGLVARLCSGHRDLAPFEAKAILAARRTIRNLPEGRGGTGGPTPASPCRVDDSGVVAGVLPGRRPEPP
jgi:subtilisin family serine protease